MLAQPDPQKKSAFKNPFLYSRAVLAIVAIAVVWILAARWLENRDFEKHAREERTRKQQEQDRITLEQMGGKELTIHWSWTPQTFLANVQPTTMSDPLAKIKKKLQDEIDQLSHELSVELPKEIAVARAHGDLSENAEYKFAKERQGYVNLKITQLKKRMGDLGMLNLSNIPKDHTGYGSRLTVLDLQRAAKIEYTLVSSEEADAEKGLISTTSPIGKALLNRKVGDEIEVATPAGKKEFEVVRLA